MIHFDFVVTEEEARIILNAISKEIEDVKRYKCTLPWDDPDADVRIKYLEQLKTKMHNKRE